MKKKIPLEVLQKIQPLIDKHIDLIIPIIDPSVAFTLKDADPESAFVFVVDHRNNNGKHVVTYKPVSTADVSSNRVELTIDELVSYFNTWLSILQNYQDTPTIFDDHAQKKYEDYFFNEFKIVSDADYAPFDPPRIFYLAEHLERVKEFVNENANLFTDADIVEEIKQDCDTLVEQLTTTPQNKVVKYLSSIHAKISKRGVTLMKKAIEAFWPELKKKLIESGVKGLIELASSLVDNAN